MKKERKNGCFIGDMGHRPPEDQKVVPCRAIVMATL